MVFNRVFGEIVAGRPPSILDFGGTYDDAETDGSLLRRKLGVWKETIRWASLTASAASVAAHHAFAAEFDANKPVTIRGNVTRIAWTNPHVWIYLNVKDEQGNLVNWGFEMGAPHQVHDFFLQVVGP